MKFLSFNSNWCFLFSNIHLLVTESILGSAIQMVGSVIVQFFVRLVLLLLRKRVILLPKALTVVRLFDRNTKTIASNTVRYRWSKYDHLNLSEHISSSNFRSKQTLFLVYLKSWKGMAVSDTIVEQLLLAPIGSVLKKSDQNL